MKFSTLIISLQHRLIKFDKGLINLLQAFQAAQIIN